MNSISTLEIRHRVARPVIALGERVRGLAHLVARIPWPRSARHATTHAFVLAIILWLTAAAIGVAGPGDRSIAGPLKGADFVHFYTLGHLAASGQVATIYNMKALHDAQVALVPDSKPDLYPTVYPPHAALLFMPFSSWPYRPALLIWCVATMALYGVVIRSAWRRVADQLPHRRMIIAAAAAFPPFWSLILYGQITILILIAFWLGWLALERGRPYLAGAAFALITLKPQFGIPLAVVVLACGEWRMLVGAVASVAAQAAIIWLTMGSTVFGAFASTLRVTLTYADWLESKPFMSHSLRAVTRLLPTPIGGPLWLALSGIVLWYTVRVWKSDAPVRIRLGVVILASLLVNPHVIIYDVTLLGLPLLWFGGYMLEPDRHADAPAYGVLVYWLFAALFIPTAAAIGVQLSVPIMTGLLVWMTRVATQPASAL